MLIASASTSEFIISWSEFSLYFFNDKVWELLCYVLLLFTSCAMDKVEYMLPKLCTGLSSTWISLAATFTASCIAIAAWTV